MSESELIYAEINGRPVTMAWFDADFNFTTPDKGTLVKIIFDDTGQSIFAVPDEQVEGTDFDPDQPRDEQGRWTSTGGGGEIGRPQVLPPGMEITARYRTPGVEGYTSMDFNYGGQTYTVYRHPDSFGKPTGSKGHWYEKTSDGRYIKAGISASEVGKYLQDKYGKTITSEKVKAEEERAKALEPELKDWRARAEALGFPPEKVSLYTGHDFVVGGENLTSGGTAYTDGTIKMDPKGFIGLSDLSKTSYMAHEVMHQRFRAVKKEAEKELDEAYRLGHAGEVSGRLKSEYYDKYPHAATLQKFNDNAEAYQKEDGVSSYSRLYWKDYAAGKDVSKYTGLARSKAANETLAEIARHVTRFGPEVGKPGNVFTRRNDASYIEETVTPRWREFYDEVYNESKKLKL